ncbi:MAG TPA: NAD-dependent protein deacetylase [Polyangiaceae bacterium]|nr:NAD-dependent protein deacetylase [Polyangiaceae bacterium]
MIANAYENRELYDSFAAGEIVVLSGAGVSTDSGIPDYRDRNGDWKRKRPVEYRDFVGSEQTRRRYWARSLIGWPHFEKAQPNAAHRSVYELERMQLVSLVITQNVDGLHQRAGSERVLDLHGRLDTVVCLTCRRAIPRAELQAELARKNPRFLEQRARVAPDGDADLDDLDPSDFELVACEACDGILKPDVVFFGENVPRPRVERAYEALSKARLLLVVGSSLMVFSGYRFARTAAKNGIPIVIVNQGKTRADEVARFKFEANAGDVLESIVRGLGSSR